MARAEALGHMTCPECDFPDAEIRQDKNGNLYRYCPDCSAQYMTHGKPHKVSNLKSKMRAIVVTVKAAVDAVPESLDPDPAPPGRVGAPVVKAEKRKGLIL